MISKAMRAGQWIACGFCCAIMVSCRPSTTEVEKRATVEGDGALVESVRDLDPGALPGEEAQLVYGGTKVPVTLDLDKEGNRITLRILAHGEPSDVEIYEEGENRFSLVNAAGESYNPPIDLLRFPFRVGSTWDWSGTMTSGGLSKKARAKVETTNERLFKDTVPMEAVKVAVRLEIDANPPDGPSAKRDLAFWFSPGKGVVRREFGPASIREPRQEP
jgi:hypothetical protein